MSDTKKAKKLSFSALLENNKIVFVFSVIVAILCWLAVSMYQTPETEKVFHNVKVQINFEGSTPYNNGFELYGNTDYYVDVTVKGKSYIVNDASFSDNIVATVSLSSVTTAGVYSLPLNVKLSDETDNAEITNFSPTYIELYFDEPITKSFDISAEVEESEDYSLAEGFTRENPRLSVDTVTLTGPSLEISKIVSVKAVVSLSGELSSTQTLEATILPVGATDKQTFANVKFESEEPVYVTVPVTFSAEYTPAVTFTNMPAAYKTEGVKYVISPSKVNVTLSSADSELIDADEISVGTIDFSQLNNIVNFITLSTKDIPYTLKDSVKEFVVKIDMSSMEKRWLEVPVEYEKNTLPKGATVTTTSIESVQIIGPKDSVMKIDSSAAYAVPVLDGITLKKGENKVPAKIILRTLTDSWVRGEYTITIVVK